MDILKKAQILSDSGNHDSCGPKMCKVGIHSGLGGIYSAKAEHKSCRIFKTLMTNSCSFDCKYCENSSSCDKKRVAYKPKELARIFVHLNHKLDVNGLFLSSGIAKDPDKVTEDMIESVKILRHKYKFDGYVHLKALPGTSMHLLREVGEISNRMSINVEAPNSSRLKEISSCKDYKNDILKRQRWISRFNLSGGQTTQVVLNKNNTDKEIVDMMDSQYKMFDLRRIYFSAFKPLKGTPMQHEPAEEMSREAHLYNIDFLRRSYGYKLKEFLPIMDDGMLPNKDPKLALAMHNFSGRLDINSASFSELVRVPGIGPITASRIMNSKTKIKSFRKLNDYGAFVYKAKPFISIEGKRQSTLSEFSL